MPPVSYYPKGVVESPGSFPRATPSQSLQDWISRCRVPRGRPLRGSTPGFVAEARWASSRPRASSTPSRPVPQKYPQNLLTRILFPGFINSSGRKFVPRLHFSTHNTPTHEIKNRSHPAPRRSRPHRWLGQRDGDLFQRLFGVVQSVGAFGP